MDLEQRAIERIRTAADLSLSYYNKPLMIAYSGGKDSDVCVELARRAGIRFEVQHSHTTADAPQTIYHIRQKFKQLELEGVNCEIVYPTYNGQRASMWSLISQKGFPPTRIMRYCCAVLKEKTGKNRVNVIGVRAQESNNRADAGIAERFARTKEKRLVFDFDNGDERIIAPCQQKAKIKIHPIVEWGDSDVWRFLQDAKVQTNPLYKCGFLRVGCIGCPMANKGRYQEFQIFPKYEVLYRHAFTRMLEVRQAEGKPTIWKNADEVFRWWMEDKNLDGQLNLFGGEIGGDG